MTSRPVRLRILVAAAALFVWSLSAQPKITTPKEAFGFHIGDDYSVATYAQLESYWKKLAAESDRMKLVDIGLTAEGRHQYMAIVSSPENIRKLDRYKDISQKLAHAEGVFDEYFHFHDERNVEGVALV